MAADAPRDEFPQVCRLFPLPGVVLFPHAVIPLHIFEPRYRQMTRDALAAGDKSIVMVRLCDDDETSGLGDPPIERIACLGRILEHQCLDDGRFNILLLGLSRVRLVREVLSDKLYRMAEVEVLQDQEADSEDRLRAELLRRFRETARGIQAVVPELEDVLNSTLTLGELTDLLAHALGLPADVQQALLSETLVVRRAESLMDVLGQMLSRSPETTPRAPAFPPPFSPN